MWFENDEPQRNEGEGDGLPSPYFSLLGDIIGGIQSAWDDFRQLVSAGTEIALGAWVRLGDLLTDSVSWYRDIDQDLADEVEGYEGYRETELPYIVFEEPDSAEGWSRRKTFASYDDLRQYMANVWHLNYVVWYNGLYELFIGDS